MGFLPTCISDFLQDPAGWGGSAGKDAAPVGHGWIQATSLS